MNALKKRPWLLVILAFVLLIAAWTAFIVIAVKNQPAQIPLESTSSE